MAIHWFDPKQLVWLR